MTTEQTANSDNKVTIKSLQETGKVNLVVKLGSRERPALRLPEPNNRLIAYPFTFPSDSILIHKIEPYDYDMFYLYYYAEGSPRNSQYIVVDGKMEVTYADKEVTDKVMESFSSWEENNLWDSLRHSFTIGTDPEIFAVDKDQNLIPAWKFLGSKENPNRTSTESSYGNEPCYWDGFGCEFTTKACTCLGYQVDSIYCGLKGIYDLAKSKIKGATLSTCSVMDISPDMMASASEEQTEFGCMPSFNAYGITVDLPPGREVPFRSTGGHLHFGIGTTTHEQAVPLVKALDAIIGVACVSLFDGYDNPRRRQYYGLPGEYRLPKHGIEYRPLSNGWLMHPIITNLVFDLSRKALMLGKKDMFKKMWKGDEQEVIDCMRNADANQARELMTRNKKLLLNLLIAAYPQMRGVNRADEVLFDLFYKGINSRIAKPTDIIGNWALDGGWSMHGGFDRNVNNNIFEMIANPNAKF